MFLTLFTQLRLKNNKKGEDRLNIIKYFYSIKSGQDKQAMGTSDKVATAARSQGNDNEGNRDTRPQKDTPPQCVRGCAENFTPTLPMAGTVITLTSLKRAMKSEWRSHLLALYISK